MSTIVLSTSVRLKTRSSLRIARCSLLATLQIRCGLPRPATVRFAGGRGMLFTLPRPISIYSADEPRTSHGTRLPLHWSVLYMKRRIATFHCVIISP